MNIIGEVAGKTAVIIDDEIDTAGSLLEAVARPGGGGRRRDLLLRHPRRLLGPVARAHRGQPDHRGDRHRHDPAARRARTATRSPSSRSRRSSARRSSASIAARASAPSSRSEVQLVEEMTFWGSHADDEEPRSRRPPPRADRAERARSAHPDILDRPDAEVPLQADGLERTRGPSLRTDRCPHQRARAGVRRPHRRRPARQDRAVPRPPARLAGRPADPDRAARADAGGGRRVRSWWWPTRRASARSARSSTSASGRRSTRRSTRSCPRRSPPSARRCGGRSPSATTTSS